MNCADKIEFVDWDKRFSDEDKNTIKEVLLDMAREHRNFKLLFIDGADYILRQYLLPCDQCGPNHWGEAHYILVEIIESDDEICVFRDYDCGVWWKNPEVAMSDFLYWRNAYWRQEAIDRQLTYRHFGVSVKL